MNLNFTGNQVSIRDLASRFARAGVASRARQIDQASNFPLDLRRRMGELGLLAMTAPPRWR